MAIQVKHTVAIQNSRDVDGLHKLFWADLELSLVTIQTFEKQVSGNIAIPNAATESLSFGDITTARGLYLEVNQDVSVRLNGGIENILLKKAPGASAAKLFLEAQLSQVTIQNASGSALTGVYAIWGDPTA
jgi:hypothetical protein